jgi:NAD+ synthase (glutamine-hydrolysing)
MGSSGTARASRARCASSSLASPTSTPRSGAVRSNVDRCVARARRDGARDVTVAVFPEQVIGGYAAEDLVQWRASSRRSASELRALRRGHASARHGASPSASRWGSAGDLFNCAAAWCTAGAIVALLPEGEAPDLQRLLRGAHALARHPLPASQRARRRGRPLGDHVYAFDFGTLAVEVCEDIWSPDGPMRRRCYSGAELVCNLSASPYRAGVTGHAPRDDRHARRRQPVHDRLRQPRRRQRRPRCSTAAATSTRTAAPMLEAPRFRRGLLHGRRRPRSHHALPPRGEHVAQRSRDVSPRAAPSALACARADGRSRAASPTPRPAGTTFFSPNARPCPSARRAAPSSQWLPSCSTISTRPSRSASPTTTARSAPSSSIGVALSGGRDSLLTLLVAWSALARSTPISTVTRSSRR